MKFDSTGIFEWGQRFGGKSTESAYEVIEKKNGGYILTGVSRSYDENNTYDIMIVSTRSDSSIEWEKVMGGYNDDYGTDLLELEDGNIMVTGYSYGYGQGADDVFLMKLKPTGDTLWTKIYAGDVNEHSYSVSQADSSGFLITGFTKSFTNGNYDAYVLKTDLSGNLNWSYVYDNDYHDRARTLEKTDDGYLVAGSYQTEENGTMDLMLFKIDYDGNLLWVKTYGTPLDEMANYMSLTEDGGTLIIGSSNTDEMENGSDMIVIRTNEFGDTLWTGLWGDSDIRELGTSGIETNKEQIVFTGVDGKDLQILLKKIEPTGFSPEERKNTAIVVSEPNFHRDSASSIVTSGIEERNIWSNSHFTPKEDEKSN
ncbi:MAG: hypothetical protein MK078_12465 [Crocinitomicaceae bacterium]|nr:hypothetical protein [Crocinitomicaceae bacterium]